MILQAKRQPTAGIAVRTAGTEWRAGHEMAGVGHLDHQIYSWVHIAGIQSIAQADAELRRRNALRLRKQRALTISDLFDHEERSEFGLNSETMWSDRNLGPGADPDRLAGCDQAIATIRFAVKCDERVLVHVDRSFLGGVAGRGFGSGADATLPVVRTTVTLSCSPDSAAAGNLRFALKLAALAYFEVRVGVDADVSSANLALSELCAVSVRYFACLTGQQVEIVAPRDQVGVAALGRLRLAAVAYASTRHGADACAELSRSALGYLCDAAIGICEACGSRKTRNERQALGDGA